MAGMEKSTEGGAVERELLSSLMGSTSPSPASDSSCESSLAFAAEV